MSRNRDQRPPNRGSSGRGDGRGSSGRGEGRGHGRWNARDYIHLTNMDEILEVKNTFDVFDEDRSGIVDPRELLFAFDALGFGDEIGITHRCLNNLIRENPNGLNFEQFLNLVAGRIQEKKDRAQVYQVFNMFDNTKVVILF